MENQEQKIVTEKKSNTNIIFIILSAVLLLVSGYLGFELYKAKNVATSQTAVIEKTTAEYSDTKAELAKLVTQYDTLETDNKALQSQLDGERERIAEISADLEKYKGDASMVKKLRAELTTIRGLIKSYLHQIDSLNVANQTLTADKQRIQQDLNNEKNVTEQLNKDKEDLNAKVSIGAQLKAINIFADGINDKGSKQITTTRAKKADKIRCVFLIGENTLAKKGSKVVYMRITGPDGNVYNNGVGDGETFTFKGQALVFSAKRDVDYEGTEKEVEMFFTKRDKFLEGKYKIELYCEDSKVGEASTELK